MRPTIKAAVMVLALSGVLALPAAPAGAGDQFTPFVTGEVSCTDDSYVIQWTLVNGLEVGTLVEDAFESGNADFKVTFSPNPTPPGVGSESHATTVLPRSRTGTFELAVQITPANDPVPITIHGSVELACHCVETTDASPSGTAMPQAVSRPRFTG